MTNQSGQERHGAWIEARLVETRQLSPTVREFRLLPGEPSALNFAPGAHVDVQVHIGGAPQTRSYSLVGLPGGTHLRFAVKMRAETSGGAPYLWSLAPGARLIISRPKAGFPIDFERPRYLLIAGGIGVTPMVGVAEALARRCADVAMLYAVRDGSELVYLDELRAVLGERLEIIRSDQGRRIDFVERFSELGPDALAALCGPLAMLDDARLAWSRAGLPPTGLRWETFGSSGRLAAEEFRVLIPRHGLDLIVPRNRSLIDALGDAGVEVMSDCRRGECGLCALPIVAVEGEVDHRDVFFSDEQKHRNEKLCACVSRATGTLVLDTDFRRDGEGHGRLQGGQFSGLT